LALPAVSALAPNLLHMLEKEEQTERKNNREVDLMAVGAVSPAPVLASKLLHVVEKRNRQRERQKEKERGMWGEIIPLP
jgi:hypothetical protein